MNATAHPNPHPKTDLQTLIGDLYHLSLVDGIPAETQNNGGKRIPIYYKAVTLRDTNVADERWAVKQAERAILVNGTYQLLESKADYRLAMTDRKSVV